MVLAAVLMLSLPLWKQTDTQTPASGPSLKMKEILAIPGAKSIIVAFFCYCALEQTVCLWSASWLHLHHRMEPEVAAGWASLFYLGITLGRLISGFITIKLNDKQMIRLGMVILTLGILMILLPLGSTVALMGLLLIGFGCAPIYPCIIHSTPEHFGMENSQAMVGVQMASAYMGNCIMPPLFGMVANHISIRLMPAWVLVILIVMAFSYEKASRKAA
jgi:fucose permease